MSGTEFTLVLSGGGMKGLAHVGVLQALEERGLEPSLIVGSSIGALIAATWATGMPLREIVARARLVRRKDVFAVAHADMAFRRMRAPAVYRREPLDDLVSSLVGTYTVPRAAAPHPGEYRGPRVGRPGALGAARPRRRLGGRRRVRLVRPPRNLPAPHDPRPHVRGRRRSREPAPAAGSHRGSWAHRGGEPERDGAGRRGAGRDGPAGVRRDLHPRARGRDAHAEPRPAAELAAPLAGAGAAARGARADVRVRPGRRAGGRGPTRHARGTRRVGRAPGASGARRAPAARRARGRGPGALRGLRGLRALGTDGVSHG
jgi:hypothetical protein